MGTFGKSAHIRVQKNGTSGAQMKILSWLTLPFMVKMQFEIYKWFSLYFQRLKYLMCCFEASVQLVPKFDSLPSYSLFELKLFYCKSFFCTWLRSCQSGNQTSEQCNVVQVSGKLACSWRWCLPMISSRISNSHICAQWAQ